MTKSRVLGERSALSVLLLIFGIFLLPTLHSCDLKKEREKVDSMFQDTVFSEHAETVEIEFSDSGVVTSKLYAPVLDRYPTEEPYTVFEKGVRGFFYGPTGKVENSVKSNYALRKDKEKLVELRNDVRLVNIKQEKLFTELLFWDQKTSRIYTDAFVKIVTPDNIIYGNGLEADQDFKDYKIFDIKGVIQVDEDEETK